MHDEAGASSRGKGTHNAYASCSFSGNGVSALGSCVFSYSYRDEFADPIDLKEGKNGSFFAKHNNLGGTPFWFTINAEETFSRTKAW